jgi:hypothetical protein
VGKGEAWLLIEVRWLLLHVVMFFECMSAAKLAAPSALLHLQLGEATKE